MRDKILQQLKQAGCGCTIPYLLQQIRTLDIQPEKTMRDELCSMESDKLVFLHRADGSANTTKGEIVLITLRPTEREDILDLIRWP